MISMTESYAAKRARWLKVRQAFPEALQEVSLRNVEDISILPKELQQVLAEAVGHIKNISKAAKMLRDHPDLSSKELVLAMNRETAEAPTQKEVIQNKTESQNQAIDISPEDISTLADTLQAFYTQMLRPTAEALAASDQAMVHILAVVASIRIATKNAKSDFVVFSLYGVLDKYRNELVNTIKSNPSFQQAIKKTSIPWEE